MSGGWKVLSMVFYMFPYFWLVKKDCADTVNDTTKIM